jgi:CHAD domain-containing protein
MSAIVKVKKSIRQPPELPDAMTCQAAFQAIATQSLDLLTAQHKGTSAGEAASIHAMRVALTRLRTIIALFAPMVEGDEEVRLAAELKWLHAHLGIVRDLDVALERLTKIEQPTDAVERAWRNEREACQRHLSRALASPRYRRLIRDLSGWIEHGDWSRKRTKEAVERRTRPAEPYCSEKLEEWRKKLVKKSRKLKDLGPRKRHRVRLANKRLNYAIEAAMKLVPPSATPAQQAKLTLLRKAQKSLGQLNDDERRRPLAAALGAEADEGGLLLDARQKKRLLRKAVKAYDELAALEPLKISGD